MIARLSSDPLDLAAHVAHVSGPAAGAVATFIGQVRDHDPSVTQEVVGLEYSAHPSAETVLGRLVEEAAAPDDVLGVACSHRTGVLAVGDAAIVVAVSAAHRGAAFAACQSLVDAVKEHLPVWKREVLADGSHVWVGLS